MKITNINNKNIFKLSVFLGSFAFIILQLISNSHALPLSWLNAIMISKSGLIFLLLDILLMITLIKFRKNIAVNISLTKTLNKIGKNKRVLFLSCMAIFLPFFIVSANATTTGTEFQPTVKWLTEHLEGSMGLTVILVDLVMGVFMVIMKKNYMALLGSVVLAVLIKFLPDILQSYVGFIL